MIRTVGHGTASATAFSALVGAAGIDVVVDVRRFPASRRHPQFDTEAMAAWLPAAGIGYRWIADLGGRRTPSPASPNVALRNPQFRAYADHMATPEFELAIGELLTLAPDVQVALMCSESVWWRCHRRLIADHLVLVAGRPVEHLFHDGRCVDHLVTPGARRADGHVVYDVTVPQ